MTVKMQEGLRHQYAGLKDEEFFQLIDATGGWPFGYEYVGFEHTDERKAGFCNTSHNTGWWTVLYHADDYYTWKLSAKGLQRIVDAALERCFVATTKYDLKIRSWRGYTLPVKKAQEVAN